MKKFLKNSTAFILASVLMPVYANAAPSEDIITVQINSEQVEFDTPPIIKNGRTLVPIRAAAEKMGLKVTWNSDTSTASIISHNKTVQLTENSNIMLDDETEITLDTAPEIINSRTHLPLRAIVEAFGAEVSWDGEKNLVSVTAPDTNYRLAYNGTFGENVLSYYYSDTIFDNTDSINHELAEFSAVAAIAAVSEDTVKAFLTDTGFSDIKTFNYELDSNSPDGHIHKSDFSLAKKTIGEKNVIAVIVRSTAQNEWYSNFTLRSEPAKAADTHYGFKTAADEITEKIKEYCSDKNALIWMCGHSRGGATVNLSANSLYKDGRNVCAYTFAAPNSVKAENADKKTPVYNFVSDNDIITKIPPKGGKWNYSLHGTTISLTSYDTERMNQKFSQLTGKTYNAIYASDVNLAEAEILRIAPDEESYYNTEYNGITPYQFFTNAVIPMLTGSSYTSGLKYMFNSDFGTLMQFFVLHAGGEAINSSGFISIEAYDDANGIAYEHCPEAYLSKITFLTQK